MTKKINELNNPPLPNGTTEPTLTEKIAALKKLNDLIDRMQEILDDGLKRMKNENK